MFNKKSHFSEMQLSLHLVSFVKVFGLVKSCGKHFYRSEHLDLCVCDDLVNTVSELTHTATGSLNFPSC